MGAKTAYVWGPISLFSASLLASLLEKGWTLHLASKSALQVSLSPLDLASSAQHNIERAAGADKFKLVREKLVFLDSDEPQKGTNYDITLFMGLPCNFDEARVSRAPWAAEQLPVIAKRLKGVPIIIISSLWGGIQADGIVPEEIEFERRKPLTHFEGVCQQYENKVLKSVSANDGKWHLVRLPVMLGSSADGRSLNFSGLYKLLHELYLERARLGDESHEKIASLSFNPDATFWMMACDKAADLVAKLVEDSARPQICNIVSTQSTLNQEWMQDLARSLELDSIRSVEKDSFNIPGTLRSMLTDNIQVKTRNLFELLGRYQQAPLFITSDYFSSLIRYAQENNWGQMRIPEAETPFSAERARKYFHEFLPENLSHSMQKSLSGFSGGLAFQISEMEECRWLLEVIDGRVCVAEYDPAKHKPQVVFQIQANSFGKITSGKMFFEQALLTKSLQASGGPIQSLKACDFFRRFLRHNRFDYSETNGRVLEGALKD